MAKKKKKETIHTPYYDETGALIYGWGNMEALVESTYFSPHRELLEGRLIFALRPPSTTNSSLQQLIIVKNPWKDEEDIKGRMTYSVGYICKSSTGYVPCALYTFLENIIPGYLEEWGIEEEIIELYKQTIPNFKIT